MRSNKHNLNRIIRRARGDDSTPLGELTKRSTTHWGSPPGFFDWAPGASDVLPGYIAENPVYVLDDDGRVVGYYGFTKEGDDLLLDKLFVDRDRIGTGCGKRLWLHAVDTARDLGYLELVIGSDPNAASFYEAMGAVWYAEKPTPSLEWTVQMFRFAIPPIAFRRAMLENAPELHALTGRSTLYWGYEPEFLDWEPQSIAVTPALIAGSVAYVLEEGDRIAGYYVLVGEPPELSLDKLFVEPDLIGTGRGKRLWLHAVATAQEMGATVLTFAADPNAAPFYRAMGAEWLREEETMRAGWNLQMFRYLPMDDPT